MDWQSLKGKHIVFDGPDGSGKTTLMRQFITAAGANGLRVMDVREPGGTTIGEAIRSLILDPSLKGMDVRTEVLLFMASRAQLITERVVPHLRDGYVVVSDRGISSTLAYQGTGGGIRFQDIAAVADAVLERAWPDLTVVCDVDYAVAKGRMHERRRPADRIESNAEDYHKRVRMGFLRVVKEFPDRCVQVDANMDPDAVWAASRAVIAQHFDPIKVTSMLIRGLPVFLYEDLEGRVTPWSVWCPVCCITLQRQTREAAIAAITEQIDQADRSA